MTRTSIAKMTAAEIAQREDAVHQQIRESVAHQSDAQRALYEKVRAAAGWTGNGWRNREPLPLKVRIKENRAVLTLGYQHALDRIMAGRAELIEE